VRARTRTWDAAALGALQVLHAAVAEHAGR